VEQRVHGVPVLGAEALFHMSARGALYAVSSTLVPRLDDLDVTPSLTADAAVARAMHDREGDLGTAVAPRLSEAPTPKLVVFADDPAAPRLAYHLRLRELALDVSDPAILDYVVDAVDGRVLRKFDALETIAATGSGIGTNGTRRTLQINQNGATFELHDMTRATEGIRTFDARNGAPELAATLPGQLVTSSNRDSWDTVNANRGAAVDAHFFAGVVYDYYKTKHNRNSFNGRGAEIVSSVHVGRAYNNAYWNGAQMGYGDGDGRQFRSFTSGLDVVAHELTHAVTQWESRLEYLNQPGALNEALSDIFAAFVENAQAPNTTKNFLIGEDVVIGNVRPFRDMLNPPVGLAPQPAHMRDYRNLPPTADGDYGGVHINSGIINNAMALMTVGGTNPVSSVRVLRGVGWDKSAALWYRAATEYFLARTTFEQAAQLTLTAAKDLAFSEDEQAIVECAWIATGVLSGACKPLREAQPADSRGPATSGSPSASGKPGDAPAVDPGAAGQQTATGEDLASQRRRTSGLLPKPRNNASCASTPAHDRGAPYDGLLLGGLAVFILALRRRREGA
jgi:Zn-dependent metalloprotease